MSEGFVGGDDTELILFKGVHNKTVCTRGLMLVSGLCAKWKDEPMTDFTTKR